MILKSPGVYSAFPHHKTSLYSKLYFFFPENLIPLFVFLCFSVQYQSCFRPMRFNNDGFPKLRILDVSLKHGVFGMLYFDYSTLFACFLGSILYDYEPLHLRNVYVNVLCA